MGRPAGMPKPPKHSPFSKNTDPNYPNAHKRYGNGKVTDVDFDRIPPVAGSSVDQQIANSDWYDESLICRCAYSGPMRMDYGRYIDLVSVKDLENRGKIERLNTPEQRLPPAGATYHIDCMKPTFYALKWVVKLCEGCDTYYVPEARIGNWPVRWNLCPRCS